MMYVEFKKSGEVKALDEAEAEELWRKGEVMLLGKVFVKPELTKEQRRKFAISLREKSYIELPPGTSQKKVTSAMQDAHREGWTGIKALAMARFDGVSTEIIGIPPGG